LAPSVDIGFVVTDAAKWEVDPERYASEFDVGYYGKLLEKAWGEVASALHQVHRDSNRLNGLWKYNSNSRSNQ